MKIISAYINALGGKIDKSFHFHDDMNVITGTNGSGKTTFLKLLWYTLSSNVERIVPEVDFSEFVVETTDYKVSLKYNKKIVAWTFSNSDDYKDGEFVPSAVQSGDDDGSEMLNQLILESGSSSVYFPTFRRIEGGYSMTNTRRIRRRMRSGEIFAEMMESDDVQSQFDGLADRLSVSRHKFVCSISTHDIINLLTTKYSNISEQLNEDYKSLSADIISKIESAKNELKDDHGRASALLSEIQKEVDTINERRKSLLKPFTILSDLTASIFRHKGIKVRSVTLGQSTDAIDSSVLSAGEKQMLSFLSYNSFYEDSPFFVDEPELSLHPDWQRRLFSTLLKQQSTNQFIVATHSPFIYSQYEDKELVISGDKGE